jgi:hypothetical protein
MHASIDAEAGAMVSVSKNISSPISIGEANEALWLIHVFFSM